MLTLVAVGAGNAESVVPLLVNGTSNKLPPPAAAAPVLASFRRPAGEIRAAIDALGAAHAGGGGGGGGVAAVRRWQSAVPELGPACSAAT